MNYTGLIIIYGGMTLMVVALGAIVFLQNRAQRLAKAV
jgi:hypothetical protein